VVLLQKKFKDEGSVVMRGGRKMQKGKEGVYGMCGNTQLFQEVYTRGFLCCLDTLKIEGLEDFSLSVQKWHSQV
jgi:hypothetical protein